MIATDAYYYGRSTGPVSRDLAIRLFPPLDGLESEKVAMDGLVEIELDREQGAGSREQD